MSTRVADLNVENLGVAQPLIIGACQRAPTGYSSEIARSLIWFDDPRAQAAVDTYMPKDWAKPSAMQGRRGWGFSVGRG